MVMKNFILEVNGKVVADSQRFSTIERKFKDVCRKHNSKDNVILVVDSRTSDIVLTNDTQHDDLFY